MLLLLGLHLYTNHRAVRAVRLNTLNRQRACLALSAFLPSPPVPSTPGPLPPALSPAAVSAQERIFERDGALRWRGGEILGWARIGVSLEEVVRGIGGTAHAVTGSVTERGREGLERALQITVQEGHVMWWDPRGRRALVVLKEGADAVGQLKAWVHALLVARAWAGNADQETGLERADTRAGKEERAWRVVESALSELNAQWDKVVTALRVAGWEVDVATLETVPGTRVRVNNL